jgi:multidrug resistance efflux pump
MAVCSLPLRRGDGVVAVLTLERAAERPFSIDEMEALRLACDLCTPRLMDLHESDRWVGARAASGIRKGAAALLGPTHTWAKIASLLVLTAVLLLIFVKGDYKIKAPFVLETTRRQVIGAPFDGYLQDVNVRPNSRVAANETVLATLDTSELRYRLAAAKAERARHLRQASNAMDQKRYAQHQMALDEAAKYAARIKLLGRQIRRAAITSPLDGTVLIGDLERNLGAAVKKGEALFEVAPLSSLRAELMVREDDVIDVQKGQQGELATTSDPATKIPFVVEKIKPVAEVKNQRNVFEVQARLLTDESKIRLSRNTFGHRTGRLRPGMEGIAKITVGQRSYGWIWTRRLVNWIRMELWI